MLSLNEINLWFALNEITVYNTNPKALFCFDLCTGKNDSCVKKVVLIFASGFLSNGTVTTGRTCFFAKQWLTVSIRKQSEGYVIGHEQSSID